MENPLPDQRQYSLEEVLSITFNIIKKHWFKFVLICLIVYLPLMVITSFIDTSYLKSIFPSNLPPGFESLKEMWNSMLPTIYFSYSLFFVGFIVNFAIAKIVESCAHAEEPSLQAALSSSFKKFFKGLITSIILGIFMFFLALPLFIPAIIFGVYWSFFMIAISLRNRWGIDALKYSYYVVKGRWWRVLGFTIVFSLIAGVAQWIPSGIGALLVKVPYMGSLVVLVSSTISSFTMIAGTVFFLNLESTSKFLVRKPASEEIPNLPEA